MSETITIEHEIPGVSGDELQIMRASAARFLEGRDDLDEAGVRMAIGDLDGLTRPADHAAAGFRAPVRGWGYYKRPGGKLHGMC